MIRVQWLMAQGSGCEEPRTFTAPRDARSLGDLRMRLQCRELNARRKDSDEEVAAAQQR
jgi:hypothetical protein